jgi:RNA polymerase sigma-70 factor (ECF subfamily)
VNERDLVLDCLCGKRGAWDRFVRAFQPVVRAAVERGFRRDPGENVDDVCQEVFLALLQDECRMLRGFQWRSSLKTWLSVVAASRAVDHLRRRKSSVPFAEGRFESVSVPSESSPERVKQSLQSLGSRDRLLLELAHRRRRSYRQIADLLGVEENSVGPALSRAEQRFKENLARLAC